MSSKIEKSLENKDEKDMQEQYAKMQMFEQQLQGMQKYLENFDQQLIDIRNLIDSIKEFSNLKKGDEILAPIASGVFIKAKLENSDELLVNVGNGVVINKTIAQTIELLESQEKEITGFRKETAEQMESLIKELGNV